jgi:hypothetical protein
MKYTWTNELVADVGQAIDLCRLSFAAHKTGDTNRSPVPPAATGSIYFLSDPKVVH